MHISQAIHKTMRPRNQEPMIFNLFAMTCAFGSPDDASRNGCRPLQRRRRMHALVRLRLRAHEPTHIRNAPSNTCANYARVWPVCVCAWQDTGRPHAAVRQHHHNQLQVCTAGLATQRGGSSASPAQSWHRNDAVFRHEMRKHTTDRTERVV